MKALRNRPLLMLCFILIIQFISCTKEEIVDPVITPPGKQKDIEWPSLAKSSWPMGHHDPQSTGRSPYVAMPEGKMGWSKRGFAAWGSPVIGFDGTVYYETDDTTFRFSLQALSSDGVVQWKGKLDSTHDRYLKNHPSPILASNGSLYIVSRDGRLYSYQTSGNLNWVFTADDVIPTKGLTIGKDGTLYFVSQKKTLFAVNSSGAELWKKTAPDGFFWGGESGPQIVFAPDGKTMYIGRTNSGLYAVSTAGNILWSDTVTTNYFFSHRLVDNEGNIYLNRGNSLTSLRSDGTVRWVNSDAGYASGGFTMDYNGNLYTIGEYPKGSKTPALLSYDYSGKIRWSRTVGDYYTGELVCDSEGTVYFDSQIEKTLYAVRSDGSIKWKVVHNLNFANFNSSPAIGSNGTFYLTADNDYLDNGLFTFK